jgi:hypothetical protein
MKNKNMNNKIPKLEMFAFPHKVRSTDANAVYKAPMVLTCKKQPDRRFKVNTTSVKHRNEYNNNNVIRKEPNPATNINKYRGTDSISGPMTFP